MARKITGATVEFDPGAPLIDVDTAITDLAEDLQRSGRQRQLIALQHLCQVVQLWGADPSWHVYEGPVGAIGDDLPPTTEREIEVINPVTRIIVLVPQKPNEAGEGVEDSQPENIPTGHSDSYRGPGA